MMEERLQAEIIHALASEEYQINADLQKADPDSFVLGLCNLVKGEQIPLEVGDEELVHLPDASSSNDSMLCL